MDVLENLAGLGPQSAKELLKRIKVLGLEGNIIDALKHPSIYPDLPIATRVDITERPDKIIPYEVILYLNETLRSCVHGVKFDIAGSFRRKKATSRDVDIVLSKGKFRTSLGAWKKFVLQTGRSVKFHKPFAGGDNKLSVLVSVRVPLGILKTIKKNHPTTLHKRVWKIKTDIFVTPPREYMFMLLYATGSGDFNIMMRAQAKRKGYLLNQRGLYKRNTNKQVPIRNVKHLFTVLGIAYRSPSDRSGF